MIRQLYPPLPDRSQSEHRQCEAVPKDVNNPRLYGWREDRYTRRGFSNAQKCQRHAQYEIDGKFFCSLHAGKIALALWVDGVLAENTTTVA
jgi:hypothetical protein